MTKQERKRRREISRRYKAAYQIHLAFKARYFEALLSTVQLLPTIYCHLTEVLTLRKRLPAFRKREKTKELIELLGLISYNVSDIVIDLETVKTAVGAAIAADRKASMMFSRYPSVRTIMADLAAVKNDFIKGVYDENAHTLTVRTEPIRLDHPERGFSVQFNEFDIVINLTALAQDIESPYKITSPRPVYPKRSSEDQFIHPHVKHNQLCEGDGADAAKLFLSRGLLQDFLVLIHQILSTYNPESPHFKLAYWTDCEHEDDVDSTDVDSDEDMWSCNVCGGYHHRDDMSTCDDCSESICEQHIAWCRDGNCHICTDCIDNRTEMQRACQHGLGACPYAGGESCLLWTNPACIACNEPPSADEMVECEINSDVILCECCAAEIIDDPERWCKDCDGLGRTGCALVKAGLPKFEEVVPVCCHGCGYGNYRGCSIMLGEAGPPKGEDEQETQRTRKEEESEDDRTPEGRPEPAASSNDGLRIFD